MQQQINNVTEIRKEQVKQIRKIIKSKCPTISVKNGTGTAGAWIDVSGSLEFGEMTEQEQKAVFELGLVQFLGHCKHGFGISPEERKGLVTKWGIEA